MRQVLIGGGGIGGVATALSLHAVGIEAATRFWRWCARCSARSRQREALSRLDDRLLEDISVTRQRANAEAVKQFWK